MGDRTEAEVHVYCVSAGNRAVFVILSIALFCVAVFVPYRLVSHGMTAAAALKGDLIVVMPMFVLALLSAFRLFQMRVTITNSRVEIIGAFRTFIVPFAEIRGRRFAAGKGARGIYLYRRGKSRVFVCESAFRLDDFYARWRDSIYDLDKADRLKRKAAGKERAMDWFCSDTEQHPEIGGPNIN